VCTLQPLPVRYRLYIYDMSYREVCVCSCACACAVWEYWETPDNSGGRDWMTGCRLQVRTSTVPIATHGIMTLDALNARLSEHN
jgi:hypothetical protein